MKLPSIRTIIFSILAAMVIGYGTYLWIGAGYRIHASIPSMNQQSGYVDILIATYSSSDLVAESTQLDWRTDQAIDSSGALELILPDYLSKQGSQTTRLRLCSASRLSAESDGLSEATKAALQSCAMTGRADEGILSSCEVIQLYGGVKGVLDLVGTPLRSQSTMTLDCSDSPVVRP